MRASELKSSLKGQSYQERLNLLYVDSNLLPYQTNRYEKAIDSFINTFGDMEVTIFSAPGRTEVCGNHTDHQHGHVLAASVNVDAIAVASKNDDNIIRILSEGYDIEEISLTDLNKDASEEGTTKALIRGVAKGLKDRGYEIFGFDAYVTSDVLIGAGLSSSAAFEVLVGAVLSGFYNNEKISSETLAIVGQYAENVYFGKPCGLMDQMACATGNLIHIDFADPENPVTEQVALDLSKYNYSLCITNTRGSHANLTPDYAAITNEMRAAAKVLGREVLGDVSLKELTEKFPAIRDAAGDRALLRAIHYVTENGRVLDMVALLKSEDFDGFLKVVKASGDSSYKYLQNVFSPSDPSVQGVSVGLSISELVLSQRGVARVHGGGFAGTIQAFVPTDLVADYQRQMNNVFGEGSSVALQIRSLGGVTVF